MTMNFYSSFCGTQKNYKTKDKKVTYFKASLDPPKKETKETYEALSAESVKKFVAKREEIEERKQLEEKKKKDKLISLRSQNKTSFKRVQLMLKRTKSAIKSVIEDAKVDDNTSLTTAEFNQPDEDDYGYVSTYAANVYENIMDKYRDTPVNTKSVKVVNNKTINHNDHSNIKNRVRIALVKEEEKNRKKLLRPKRKMKLKDIKSSEDRHCNAEPQKKKSKTDLGAVNIKKRRMHPPQLSYQELLKVAEKLQHEPTMVGKKKKCALPLMTKIEKEKYLEKKKMEARKYARWRKAFLQTSKWRQQRWKDEK